MRFSANLGFLWAELPLQEAVRAAQRAGFSAVEFHWPYDTPVADLKAALEDTGLPVLGLNTVRGPAGENGLAALVGREDEAKAAIDQAVAYGSDIGAGAVHVMCGFAQGEAARGPVLGGLIRDGWPALMGRVCRLQATRQRKRCFCTVPFTTRAARPGRLCICIPAIRSPCPCCLMWMRRIFCPP